MLSHPAYLFLQGSPLCSVFRQVPVLGATCWNFLSQDLEMVNLKEQHLDSLCKDWQVYFCSQAFL